MTICQFFLQGRCRFGDRCWNEHPRGGGGRPHSGPVRGAGGGWGAASQRYANVIQPPIFKHSTWGGSGDGGGFSGASDFGSPGNKSAVFSQNRFSALSSAHPADGFSDEEQRLLDCVAKDMATWESSGQWMFSCYSPEAGKPNVSGFREFSAEEVRLEYYNCSANNNTENYINSVNQLVQEWRNRLQELKALNASGKESLLSQLKNAVTQPLPSLGFGGQQASSFGFPSFPVSSSSSAASFSFKANPSVPPGNAAAVGSSAAASNPPTFGVTSSPSVPNPVGSGNSSAPSAASFSFKTSGTTSGCGTSGLSGFGSSAAANSSSTAPLPVSATPSAATGTSQSGASSASAAQTAGASGHNVTSAPSAVPNGIASDKLYTPRSELTAEELEQFEAKRFTLGKIPLKPPPIDLLYL
ncbi:nucleoporin NUP42 isoform 2 [Gallus gallus]|uniref:nucleoporin NUP42 isoform 2 n=1 Tax=Gallus gallus TaxID=9031 RepID=UPI000D63E5EB|nr:nucleoporin NUP42 isoform 2 [Gallus gallus]|eukprot:XP_015136928.2 nucleoporin-like protein 2 isoform X1 [Gallus gallus]